MDNWLSVLKQSWSYYLWDEMRASTGQGENWGDNHDYDIIQDENYGISRDIGIDLCWIYIGNNYKIGDYNKITKYSYTRYHSHIIKF